MGKVAFWGRTRRYFCWLALCKLSSKPCPGPGWAALAWLGNVGTPVLWFQLIFFAVISLNFQGSLCSASDDDIL